MVISCCSHVKNIKFVYLFTILITGLVICTGKTAADPVPSLMVGEWKGISFPMSGLGVKIEMRQSNGFPLSISETGGGIGHFHKITESGAYVTITLFGSIQRGCAQIGVIHSEGNLIRIGDNITFYNRKSVFSKNRDCSASEWEQEREYPAMGRFYMLHAGPELDNSGMTCVFLREIHAREGEDLRYCRYLSPN